MASLSSLLSVSPYSGCKIQSSIIPLNKRHGVNNYVSCKASNHIEDSVNKFDRRDVLFGLGGLYGVATLSGNDIGLAADWSLSPDVHNCKPSKPSAGKKMDCCPPKINKIIEFTPPVVPTLRVRPAVHLMTPDQIADLEKGIQMMKNLPEDDPCSFAHQAKVHCAYCNDAYKQIEMSPHNNIHNWVGDPEATIQGENMGHFHSAGKDPVFYAHHTNVDRMWNIWQKMKDQPRDHTDPDWLNSSFVLYDENRKADNPPIPRPNRWERRLGNLPPTIDFPQILSSDITTMVDRPEVASPEERINKNEVLVLEDVEFDPTLPLHFDVLLNVGDDGEDVRAGDIEFVGTFTNVPHGRMTHHKTSLHFVLTKKIVQLGLEGDKKVAVKIVPNVNGGDRIKIGGIKIQLEDIE
uniref:Tyrosinase copper-binding domain-containing protein n=1 Tax=Cucumis sativus TaxID=3659 RepID=A0A0A0LV27_CUCSA